MALKQNFIIFDRNFRTTMVSKFKDIGFHEYQSKEKKIKAFLIFYMMDIDYLALNINPEIPKKHIIL